MASRAGSEHSGWSFEPSSGGRAGRGREYVDPVETFPRLQTARSRPTEGRRALGGTAYRPRLHRVVPSPPGGTRSIAALRLPSRRNRVPTYVRNPCGRGIALEGE